MGSQLGIGHKSIAAASVMELAVIVVSAVLFAAAVSFREAAEALRYFSSYIIEKKLLFYCIGVMVILAGAFLYVLYRFRLFNRLKPYWNLGLLKVTAKAIAFYMLVHVISGCFLSGIFLLFLHQKNQLHYSGLGKCDCLAAWIYNGRQPGRHWDKGSGACVFTAECLSKGGCGDCGGDFTVMLCTCRFYILCKCLGDKEIQRDGHV